MWKQVTLSLFYIILIVYCSVVALCSIAGLDISRPLASIRYILLGPYIPALLVCGLAHAKLSRFQLRIDGKY